MSVALLDVNVLIAIFNVAHRHNDAAHRWLRQNRNHGWATCPLTINGCIRILTNPSYFDQKQTTSQIADYLREFCSATDHHFWPDSVSLLDDTLFTTPAIRGHQNITDVYLLGLAVRNHGRLATFDRSIPLKAVRGARPSHLAVIDG